VRIPATQGDEMASGVCLLMSDNKDILFAILGTLLGLIVTLFIMASTDHIVTVQGRRSLVQFVEWKGTIYKLVPMEGSQK
jgi:small neutral amino acid transporter SnatA (MarC family)